MESVSGQIIVENTNFASHIPTDTNPMEVRWAFQAAQRDKILNAQDCGVARVPFAKFFPVKTFITPRENHTTDEYKPREIPVTILAEDCQKRIEEALGGKGAQISNDWGIRFGFVGERDTAKMEVISQTLLPTLSSIHAICDEFDLSAPVSQICEGSDELDYGTRETCVTCWYKWLRSDALESYMLEVSEKGLEVMERDPQTLSISRRLVRPTMDEFVFARGLAIESFTVGINALQKQWSQISKEEEKGERKSITDFEHTYRKDLHEAKTADKQFALADKFAKANSGQNTDILQMLAQSQAALAQSNADTQALLRQVLINNQNPPQQQQQQQQQRQTPITEPAATDETVETLTPQQKAAATRQANKQQEQENGTT